MPGERPNERWAVVYEPDDDVRECLRDVLDLFGFTVLTPVRRETLLALLACRRQPVHVLLSNGAPDHADVAAILARVVASPDLRRHRYALLSTLPKGHLPRAVAAHLAQLDATLLPKPFDLADLEAALAVPADVRELVTA
jgi:hypothetical protein